MTIVVMLQYCLGFLQHIHLNIISERLEICSLTVAVTAQLLAALVLELAVIRARSY